jgi:hypothetical protein
MYRIVTWHGESNTLFYILYQIHGVEEIITSFHTRDEAKEYISLAYESKYAPVFGL